MLKNCNNYKLLLQLIPIESLANIVNDILPQYDLKVMKILISLCMKYLFNLDCDINEYTYDEIIFNCTL